MSDSLGILLAAGKGSRMKSDLPKVLHKVGGLTMARRGVDAMRAAGIDDIVLVVGYRQELVRAEFGDSVRYAVQEEQLGTGHAVMAARAAIEQHHGPVVIGYGDAPLMSPRTLARLEQSCRGERYSGSLLSIVMETPPQAGRIIRAADGQFLRIVEDQDCTPEQALVREVNVGQYAFMAEPLLAALSQLRPNNSQGEYYLTDVPEALVKMGHDVEVVETKNIVEALGVNDRHHLEFAESIKHIEFAETMFPIVDATIEMQRLALKETK